MSRFVICFAIIAALVSGGCGDSASQAATAPASPIAAPVPAEGLFKSEVVPLPAKVKQAALCNWTRDGEFILCSGLVEGETGRQVVLFRPDGSDFSCATCGKARAAGISPEKLFAFADGKRVLVESIDSGAAETRDQSTRGIYVLECAPSLRRCDNAQFFSIGGIATTTGLQDREPRLSPDDRHLAYTKVHPLGFWMVLAELERTESGYEARNTRLLNTIPAPPLTDEDFRVGGAFHEIKSFRGGGRLIFTANRASGGSVDNFEMDLANGQVRQVTFNAEYDEPMDYRPGGGNQFVIGSARAINNVVRAAALIPTVPYFGFARTQPFTGWKLGSEAQRNLFMEIWLATEADEMAGRDGVQLSDAANPLWGTRVPPRWSPEGDQLVWYERDKGDLISTRVVVTTLKDRAPIAPECLDAAADDHCQTPALDWAPLLADYRNGNLIAGVHVVTGPGGGQALLNIAGTMVGGLFRVDYRDFKTASGHILNGSSQLIGAFNGPAARSTETSDVVVTGAQGGSLKAEIDWNKQNSCGYIQSRLAAQSELLVIGEAACGP